VKDPNNRAPIAVPDWSNSVSSLALEDPKKMTDCHSALGYLPICRVSPGMGRAFGGLEDIEEMDRSKIESKASPSNRRRNPRVAANARITIYLEDGRGGRRSIEVRAIDISRTGILVQSDHPLPTGAVGFLQTPTLNLAGRATVRYCRQQGLGYRIGMYLPDALILRSLLRETDKTATPKA